MKPKAGQYFYAPRGRFFRIYRYEFVSAGATTASPVQDEPFYHDRQAARRRVYQLNGWHLPTPKEVRPSAAQTQEPNSLVAKGLEEAAPSVTEGEAKRNPR